MFNIKNLKIKENYIPFTEYQLAVLDMQQYNGGKTKKIQSVLRYIIEYSVGGKLMYSINRLFVMYSSKGKRMSRKYFYNLVQELKDLSLVEQKDNDLFLVLEKKVYKKVHKKVHKENCTPSLENTSVEGGTVPALNTQDNNNNYNIYNTTPKEFCPSKNATFASIEQLKSIAEDLYKNLKIRSNHVKTEVLNVIYAYEGRIYLKAARSYLKAVILDKKVARDKEREEFAKKYIFAKNIARVNKPATVDTFGNYTSNNRKRLAQVEAHRQYLSIEDTKQFENIGTDWQNDDWCM